MKLRFGGYTWKFSGASPPPGNSQAHFFRVPSVPKKLPYSVHATAAKVSLSSYTIIVNWQLTRHCAATCRTPGEGPLLSSALLRGYGSLYTTLWSPLRSQSAILISPARSLCRCRHARTRNRLQQPQDSVRSYFLCQNRKKTTRGLGRITRRYELYSDVWSCLIANHNKRKVHVVSLFCLPF